mmetsp:Transcript_53718/g.114658  ORF Transcript_53718/g.114658 Transcript_53718/m.114658 type:complete len:334 (-) Transcript_53718:627-1628(-)
MQLSGTFGTKGLDGMPSAMKIASSTRSTPQLWMLCSWTGPPPIRAFTSMSWGPVEVYLHSTWKTPPSKPNAFTHATANSLSSRCCCRGKSEGMAAQVSLNQGSTVGPLSVIAAYLHSPSDMTTSTSTSVPSRYCSKRTFVLTTLLACTPAPDPSFCTKAPLTTIKEFNSFWTSSKTFCSSASLSTFLTPKEAAPLTGLSTAGNPTVVAAVARSVCDLMRCVRGVGSPARRRAARVSCLSRAASTAAGLGPGRPSCSQIRATMGTESSTIVRTASASPHFPSLPRDLMAASASFKTSSAERLMSSGTNLEMMPSSTNSAAHESGCSMMTVWMPN